MKPEDLCGMMINEGVLEAETADRLIKRARESSSAPLDLLHTEAGVPYERISIFLWENFGIPAFSRDRHRFDTDALDMIDPETAVKHTAIPVFIKDNKLYAAFADPFSARAYEDFVLRGRSVAVMYAPAGEVRKLIEKYYGASLRGAVIKKQSESSAAQLLDLILDAAVNRDASDIHIEPFDTTVRVRLRLDGALRELETLPAEMLPTLISRIKILSGMDISERRLPQDGHFKQKRGDKKIDFRVSVIHTIHGEKAVVRLIYDETGALGKYDLGFFEDGLEQLNALFNRRQGMILLTGPTGCGKTTTLAACVKELNTEDVNIVTIEDPTENVIYGVNQIDINPKAGFDFANALRSILRQDPDVIMVGEIRDEETAALAVRSAVTGHLVLSTLHTGDAVSAVYRLIDMNVPDYLVYSAIAGIVSQRLIRRICRFCKTAETIKKEDAYALRLPEDTAVYYGAGCPECENTGYAGRFAVYEILAADDGLKQFLWQRPPESDIKRRLADAGMRTIWDCAVKNVLLGNTTVREMYGAVFE